VDEAQREKQKTLLNKPLEEKIAEIFIGIGYGITAVMFFAFFWIPIVALLLVEYRWIFK